MLPVKEMPRAAFPESAKLEAARRSKAKIQRSGHRAIKILSVNGDIAKVRCCTRSSAVIWSIASRCSRCATPTSAGSPPCQGWSSSILEIEEEIQEP